LRVSRLNTSAFVFITLLVTSMLSTVVIFPVSSLNADSMWIEPISIDGAALGGTGAKFNVTIWLNVTTPANSWQFYLVYDKAVLNATRAAYTGVGKSLWSGALPADAVSPGKGTHNATHDYMLHAESLKSSAEQTGSGSLSWIEFEIVGAPGVGETIASALRLDLSGIFESIVMDAGFNPISLTFGEAAFTYTGGLPTTQPWLEAIPNSITAMKPREFDVSVYIRDLEAGWQLNGAQFTMNYNSTFINATNITPGTFMSDPTWAIHGSFPMWQLEESQVIYGELILPNATNGQWDLPQFPYGEGLIATITFEPLLHEATSFDITLLPLFDEYFLSADNFNYIPYAAATNCSYTYDPLPKPTLAVDPATSIANQVGENFSIDITIADLDERWNLTYVEFKLGYNSSFLEVLDVTEGAFMSQYGSTTFDYEEDMGYVKVNVTLVPDAELPSGSGVLATITFNASTSVPAYSDLLLSDVVLKDIDDADVLYDLSHGSYVMHEVLIHEIVVDSQTFYVETVSDASVAPVPMEFNADHRLLGFNVTGFAGATYFVNVTIPRSLIDAAGDNWLVLVGGWSVSPTIVPVNGTHVMLSFDVGASTMPVYIVGTWAIPEFPVALMLALLFIVSLIGLAFVRLSKLKRGRELFSGVR